MARGVMAMTNAFKCDRCGEFEEGDPDRYRTKYYANAAAFTGWTKSRTLHEAELCEDCAEAFVTTIQAFFNDEPTDLADDIERWWREKERELRQTAPPRGGGDD